AAARVQLQSKIARTRNLLLGSLAGALNVSVPHRVEDLGALGDENRPPLGVVKCRRRQGLYAGLDGFERRDEGCVMAGTPQFEMKRVSVLRSKFGFVFWKR